MPEAEELLTDAARHLTVFARSAWVRHRGRRARGGTELVDVARRVELLVHAVWGRRLTVRNAQPPAPVSAVARWFRGQRGPRHTRALPSTDGVHLWLPPTLDGAAGMERYQALALLQAMRVIRGAPFVWSILSDPLEADVYLLLEAFACEEALVRILPGLERPIRAVRRDALASRPPLKDFPPARRPLEALARSALEGTLPTKLGSSPCAEQVLDLARALASSLDRGQRRAGSTLLKDQWTGELRAPPSPSSPHADGQERSAHPPARSARLPRRPELREASEEEGDDRDPGAWMVQTSAPQEKAEDPMGLQRPIDRDADTSAEELADAVSELEQARLVRTPSPPKEVLLSDDSPSLQPGHLPDGRAGDALRYPEWDYRIAGYHASGAAVRVLAAPEGPQQWVDRTLRAHRPMLEVIRRRFELLRAGRGRLRRRLDGDELDLEACVESEADFTAGRSRSQALYQLQRPLRRSVAVLLLVDASGSTDGWVAAHRRVVDVEREALLLVSIALDAMREPFAIHAFSGEGREGVVVRELKDFQTRFGEGTSRRIAGLEPEHYTRVGAALRHAAAQLMRQPAEHRLLILLSDGKPNDGDLYEGRYGIEDTRQAVVEARAQGIYPFCLTIDHRGPEYLGRIFGAGGYALLPRPELLPSVLLDWLRRLVAG